MEEQGQRLLSFPFRSHGYLVHLGRATLATVAHAEEATNRYYPWARDHHEPHFGLHPHGAALAAAFEATYMQVIGADADTAIVRALLRAEQVTITAAAPDR
jgi:hypothetical protein